MSTRTTERQDDILDDKLIKTLNGLSPEKLDMLLSAVEKKTGKNKKEVLDAVNDGGGEKLGALLGKMDKRKLDALLSDKKAVEQLLSDPRAKKLLDGLLG